jgi:hypothetical protein
MRHARAAGFSDASLRIVYLDRAAAPPLDDDDNETDASFLAEAVIASNLPTPMDTDAGTPPTDGALANSGSQGRGRGRPLASRLLLGHVGAVYAVTWAAEQRLLASGGADGCVRLWSTELGANLAVLQVRAPEAANASCCRVRPVFALLGLKEIAKLQANGNLSIKARNARVRIPVHKGGLLFC